MLPSHGVGEKDIIKMQKIEIWPQEDREKLPRDHRLLWMLRTGCQGDSAQMAKDGIPAWVLTASSSAAQAGSLSGDVIPRETGERLGGKGEEEPI